MTLIQWRSLAARVEPSTVLSQLPNVSRFQRVKTSKGFDVTQMRSYLRNGWATETLLHNSRTAFDGVALNNSLVWAYPQTYYAVFSVALAYFHTVGFTEGRTHAGLIRKFGDEVVQGHYPVSVSCYANGGLKKNHVFTHCAKDSSVIGLNFDPSCVRSRDSRIASMLSATREIDLKDRLSKSKHKTKSGRPKRRFSDEDFAKASMSEGVTSILSYLYRKRIKSNYEDVDSILSQHLNASEVYDCLLLILRSFNLIHEGYIIQCIGFSSFDAIVSSEPGTITEHVKKRCAELRKVITKM